MSISFETVHDILKPILRLTTDAYDLELRMLVESAVADLRLAGIDCEDFHEAPMRRAVITYCRMNFGSPANYDQLKASYDEQKAQLQMATGYGLPKEESDDV